MKKTAEPLGNTPESSVGKQRSRRRTSILPVIHVLSAKEMRTLRDRYQSSRGQLDPRTRALLRDASGMRPGDVLIEHMQGLEETK
ncbi:hypothetical protein [Caballeronia sp. TF1N1]|uniref:hypothetical protein n=1 Tax=Caballeronia sp. TF1N1 TaxID=2878153 RepID=UPI001FD4E3C5|nr:hypothetical protein [Caballeronia sp. TF1N1]